MRDPQVLCDPAHAAAPGGNFFDRPRHPPVRHTAFETHHAPGHSHGHRAHVEPRRARQPREDVGANARIVRFIVAPCRRAELDTPLVEELSHWTILLCSGAEVQCLCPAPSVFPAASGDWRAICYRGVGAMPILASGADYGED
jgi:hypothetical protein